MHLNIMSLCPAERKDIWWQLHLFSTLAIYLVHYLSTSLLLCILELAISLAILL